MSGDSTNLFGQFGRGDRSKFFFHLEFVPDPEVGCVSDEEQATWGRFQIWADGRNLCAHYVDGVLQEYVTWYLLPVLEWVATEWDYLFHEQRFPYRNVSGSGGDALRKLNSPETFDQPGGWDSDAASCVDNWARRHSILMHREGGLFPDIWLRRLGECIEVSWTADAPAGAPEGLQFCNGDGAVGLSPHDVAIPLFSVLSDAVSTLRMALPKSRRVRDLNNLIHRLTKKERRLSRLGILAGLGRDPSVWRTQWEQLVGDLRSKYRRKTNLIKELFAPAGAETLFVGGECAGALMFASVRPTIDAKDALTLAELLLNQTNVKSTHDKLKEYVRSEPVKPTTEPWVQGYALAQEWAETSRVGVDGDPVDIEKHLRDNGVQITDIELADTSIGAVAIAHASKRPVVAVNIANARNKYPTGRKFTLAHELCHLLYDRHHGVELQIVSGEWAPVEIEKRANAFAAALLMPDALIIRAAREENVDLAHLDYAGLFALAKKTDVSLDALGHHLVNRRWIDEAQRAELMASSVDLGGAKERKVSARKVRRETVPTQLVREKV